MVRSKHPTPRPISSAQNPSVKALKALTTRKGRKESGLFLAEGPKVVASARDSGWIPETIAVETGWAPTGIVADLLAWGTEAGADLLELSEAVMARLSTRDNPQPILASFRQCFAALPDPTAEPEEAVWIALEAVRDPGNLGTIIRTVDAVGARGVMLVGTCCEAFGLEAVRATMGSIFTVPLVAVDDTTFRAYAAAWPGACVATHLEGSTDYRRAYPGPRLLVMGSEGPGLSPELTAVCRDKVRIPMVGGADSLNLAVASALMLYEIRRPDLPHGGA